MLNKQGQINRVAKIVPLTLLLLSAPAMSENNTPQDEGLVDMSDPLAVFTMAGFGVTNRGLNLKVAKSYDTGDTDKLGMNVIEIKGIYSDILGWESNTKDSVDSLRVRNFTVNPTNGRGSQIDMIYDLNSEAGSLSYSMLQALPA